jgi:hypothetical protein
MFYILTLVPQTIVVLYVGWKNKEELRNYFLIFALLFLVNLIWEYFSKLVEKLNIIDLYNIPLNSALFYFNLFSIFLSLTAFSYLFIHGIFNDHKAFTSTGVSMIFIDTYFSLMSGIILLLIILG